MTTEKHKRLPLGWQKLRQRILGGSRVRCECKGDGCLCTDCSYCALKRTPKVGKRESIASMRLGDVVATSLEEVIEEIATVIGSAVLEGDRVAERDGKEVAELLRRAHALIEPGRLA